MANFNNQAKRKRELAKQDKRAAKDKTRAQRKAAARGVSAPAPAAVSHAAPSVPKSTISRAAAEWMKPVSKKPAVKTRPMTVAANAFIRRLNIGS